MIDDAELLRRYAEEGSEDAFAELVRRHIGLAYAAALRHVDGDTHLAQDAVQVVFTLLARRAASLTSHPMLAGWLFVSTRHAAAKLSRTERRRQLRQQKAYAMEEPADSDSASVDWERLRPVLDEVIYQLKDVDREAILLRFFEQRPFEEIGRALQLSEEAARKRVDRALDKLRELLAARHVTSTSAALGLVLAAQPGIAMPAGLAATVSSTALASAASAGPLAALLRAVGHLTVPLGATAAALVLLAGAVWRQNAAQRGAAAALDAANRDLAARVAALGAVEQRSADRAQEAAALSQKLAEARQVPRAATWDPVAEGRAFLAAHPEVKRAMVEHSRAKLNFRFATVYRDLGLDAAAIARLQDLLRELEPGNDSAGIDNKRLVLSEGEGRPRGEIESELVELLGADGYRVLRAASDARPARQLVFELCEALYFTEAPLGAPAAQQLVRVMTEHRSREGFDWESVCAQAETFLTPAQMPALRGLRFQSQVAKLMGFRWIGPLPPPSGTFMPPK